MKYRIVTGPKGGTDWIYYMLPVKGKIQIYEAVGGQQSAFERAASLRTGTDSLYWIPVAEPPTGFPHPDEGKFTPAADYLSGVLQGNDAWVAERLMILRAAAPYCAGLSFNEIFVSLDGDHSVKFGSQQVHLKWRIERGGQTLTGHSFKSRSGTPRKKAEMERLGRQIKQAVETTFENAEFEVNF